MHEPLVARALGGRVWRLGTVTAPPLALTASFGALVDAGWSLERAFLGGALLGLALLMAGVAVQHRQHAHRQGAP